jgi:lipopolysaccharide transport system ATP-binding protein
MVIAISAHNAAKQRLVESADRQRPLLMALRRARRAPTLPAPAWSLRDVSFRIGSGTTVGIIGDNGAGKSTLLRLIAGLGRPDTGKVLVNGHVAALLDPGGDCDPDRSGRENMYTHAIIAGITKRELDQGLADAIARFAEIELFVDSPLRTYSPSMIFQLAFAITTSVRPDIVLIDEALDGADRHFQQKCLGRLAELRRMGKTIVLVSHDLELVRQQCDEVIWLHGGRVEAQGTPSPIVERYKVVRSRPNDTDGASSSRSTAPEPHGLTVNANRFGTGDIEITAVQLLNRTGQVVSRIRTGEPLTIELVYTVHQPVAGPIFGVSFARADGVRCYDTSTQADGFVTAAIDRHGIVRLAFDALDLLPGSYRFDVGVYRHDWAYPYDYHWQAYPLEVWSDGKDSGIFRPPHRWSYQALPTASAPTRAALEDEVTARAVGESSVLTRIDHEHVSKATH